MMQSFSLLLRRQASLPGAWRSAVFKMSSTSSSSSSSSAPFSSLTHQLSDTTSSYDVSLHAHTYAPEPPEPITEKHIDQLCEFIAPVKTLSSTSASPLVHHDEQKDKRLVVITGAGISTESGIPDYRSPKGSYSKGHKPLLYQEFVNSHYYRKRYWGRAYAGWHAFKTAKPNEAHKALARLQQENLLSTIITQNVDGLHQQAGSTDVIDLHGNSQRVRCISCKYEESRNRYHSRIKEINPWFQGHLDDIIKRYVEEREHEDLVRADGDMKVSEEVYHSLEVPSCPSCTTGVMKPTVVFFGENVPVPTVEKAMSITKKARGMLVIGSSLTVYSSWRFVAAIHAEKAPVGLINVGSTRADPIATFKIEARAAEILPKVYEKINGSRVI
eukprot:TRINITY_DN2960_c1_g1_i2.p1 TRINITY_DN2960_c1_g1~~TRINITY_DN2960_c1_g1_i2.p1  ORF type:complete len:386 (-),score=70.34 TRINITY_DN2960_c1_g1_i2:83-1240(-)